MTSVRETGLLTVRPYSHATNTKSQEHSPAHFPVPSHTSLPTRTRVRAISIKRQRKPTSIARGSCIQRHILARLVREVIACARARCARSCGDHAETKGVHFVIGAHGVEVCAGGLAYIKFNQSSVSEE